MEGEERVNYHCRLLGGRSFREIEVWKFFEDLRRDQLEE